MSSKTRSMSMPLAHEILSGRAEAMSVSNLHFVHGRPIKPPFPANLELAMLGLGCFWGAERKFWQLPGVYSTAVGYAGGTTPNPTYEEVCSGRTGHTEVVLIAYDPAMINYLDLLKVFWEVHDPTQGMQQGGDIGTQYRSAIYTYAAEQQRQALAAREQYQAALAAAGHVQPVTTEIREAPEFYYAETYHQQYLAKHPDGYCGLGGTGICYPPS